MSSRSDFCGVTPRTAKTQDGVRLNQDKSTCSEIFSQGGVTSPVGGAAAGGVGTGDGAFSFVLSLGRGDKERTRKHGRRNQCMHWKNLPTTPSPQPHSSSPPIQ